MTLRFARSAPLVVTLVTALVTTPFASLAQETKPAPPPAADAKKTEEASVRYKRGIELYAEENYKAALVEFKKAYELTNAYKVLYNIGQVCYQLQDYVCAVTSFEDYLKRGGTEISEKRREEVTAEVKKLRPRIASVTIVTNVDGVDITIDDVPRGKTPLAPVLLSAGSHRVTAVKEGRLPVTQSFEVAGADTPTIKLELVDAGGKVVVREGGPQSRWTTLSYIGLGVTGALAIGAGVTGVMALSASEDLKNKQWVGETPSDDAKSTQSRVKTLRLTSDILTAAAVITLGTTLILTLTRKVDTGEAKPAPVAKRPAVDVSFSFGLGSAAIFGEF